MKNKIFLLFLFILINCSKSNLEKINIWLEKEEYEKLLEFSNKNKSKLTEEEIYLSSVAVSKFQNFLRQNKSEDKISNAKYIQSLENNTGLKFRLLSVDNGNIITIEDNYQGFLNQSKYYKDKSILDKFRFTSSTNEVYENSFLLTDILEIDPRLYLQDFKTIWIESMKLGIPANLSEESRNKFILILHFLASKEETDLKNLFFITEGTNVNLRSGPGIENVTVGKLNKEEVFQIDSDYNTTSVGNKSGKWIQIYVWSLDISGWIFSPYLILSKPDNEKAKRFEQTLIELTKFQTIDFNDWNPEEIPDKFYGNYVVTKKEILEANIGFTIYESEMEKEICTKLKKDLRKVEISFADQGSSSRIHIFSLKAVRNSKAETLTKIEIWNHRLYLNSKELTMDIEAKKLQNFELKLSNDMESQLKFSLKLSSNSDEIFQTVNYAKIKIDSWELCIPQGKKSSSHILLFGLDIY